MTRIVNHCFSNLNYKKEEILGDDITNEITISTSPVLLFATTNLNRKLIKIYFIQSSNPSALVWIHHGISSSLSNFAFALPVKRLYETTVQAHRPLSVVSSQGTALLRLTVVNKS